MICRGCGLKACARQGTKGISYDDGLSSDEGCAMKEVVKECCTRDFKFFFFSFCGVA